MSNERAKTDLVPGRFQIFSADETCGNRTLGTVGILTDNGVQIAIIRNIAAATELAKLIDFADEALAKLENAK